MNNERDLELEQKLMRFIQEKLIYPVAGQDWLRDEFADDASTDEPIQRLESWLATSEAASVSAKMSAAEVRTVVIIEKDRDYVNIQFNVRSNAELIRRLKVSKCGPCRPNIETVH